MDHSPNPILSILLVNWNGRQHLPDCLDSLLPQLDSGIEVVLVDNGSTDGSVEFLQRVYPWVRLVEAGSNLGFAGGNNLGIAHCRGQFVFFLNNDTKVMEGSIAALKRGIFDFPDIQIFAPIMLRWKEPHLVDSAGDTFYTWGLPFSHSGWPADHEEITQHRFVPSACAGAAVYSREVLRRTDGFDEDLFLLFEDIDLGLRAGHLGYRTLTLPEVRILHKGSATIGKQSDLAVRQHARNVFLVRLKTYPMGVLLKHLPKLLLVSLFSIKGHILHGQMGAWWTGFQQMLTLLPRFLGKRSQVMRSSKMKPQEFEAMLRKGWLQERK